MDVGSFAYERGDCLPTRAQAAAPRYLALTTERFVMEIPEDVAVASLNVYPDEACSHAQPLPSAPYFVFVSRVETRSMIDVWPIELNDFLPAITVPLLPEDQDVMLDLQLALKTVYDLVGYDLAVDYRRPPEVKLSVDEASLTNQLVRQ